MTRQPTPLTAEEIAEWMAEAWNEREEIERQFYEGELSTRELLMPKFVRIMHELELTQERYTALRGDKDRLDWLNEQVVNVIVLDDGSLIDARGNDVRPAIDLRRAASHRRRAR